LDGGAARGCWEHRASSNLWSVRACSVLVTRRRSRDAYRRHIENHILARDITLP
jgi:hypothetical protein